MTTGAVDMKAARRWFYRTVGAALVLLAGLAVLDYVQYGGAREALFAAQAGSEAAKRHDPDTAITLYNKAIGASTLDSDTQAEVIKARGMARLQKQDWDGAVTDFTDVAKRRVDDPEAYFGLGLAQSGQGNDEAALRELDRAINLNRNPDDILPDVFAARGDTYLTLGQYQRGIQDFDEALRRRPTDAGAHGGRGEAYFYLGQFDKAEADLAAAVKGDGKMAYYALWLWLAQSHQGKDGKTALAPNASGIDLKTWPGPVIDFYLGKVTADQLASAVQAGDAKTQHDQQCEVNFYLGEHALLTGDKDEGKRLLGEAVNNCDHRFIEYMGAKAELARLAG